MVWDTQPPPGEDKHGHKWWWKGQLLCYKCGISNRSEKKNERCVVLKVKYKKSIFTGHVNAIRVYDRALTDEEMKTK